MSNIYQEIKELKLYKIQILEDKAGEFGQKYRLIKKNAMIRVSSNLFSNAMRFILSIFCFGFILFTLMSFFPHETILIMEKYQLNISQTNNQELIQYADLSKYISLFMAFLFYRMGRLIKKNIQLKNTMSKLSELVDEMIDCLDTETAEEKRRYENLKVCAHDLSYSNKKQA